VKHATAQEWQDYAAGELAPQRYEELEEHLYDCESCLQLYIQVIDHHAAISEADESLAPELEAGAQQAFADRVMLAIHGAPLAAAASVDVIMPVSLPPAVKSPVRPVRRTSLIRRPLFQYTLAAAATLLLISTGVFQNIGQIVERDNRINSPIPYQEKLDESFSQRLMEKTTSLLGSIHSNRTGGSLRE
jgi:hypothetical protein